MLSISAVLISILAPEALLMQRSAGRATGYHVFISCGRGQGDFADKVKRSLERHGYIVFRDNEEPPERARAGAERMSTAPLDAPRGYQTGRPRPPARVEAPAQVLADVPVVIPLVSSGDASSNDKQEHEMALALQSDDPCGLEH